MHVLSSHFSFEYYTNSSDNSIFVPTSKNPDEIELSSSNFPPFEQDPPIRRNCESEGEYDMCDHVHPNLCMISSIVLEDENILIGLVKGKRK